ncbi:hypothetical protein EST38_g9432 [Candolleomyces aberdarensis]|uniref:Enoyl reductase (ER) domain-containing protein n=1 Tax=Candolleomyces aberdarensis TaxID=2316362 RepID=A0A4Q2DBN5_9AGAR|nr:hypothetical protein EST38_g9432 [Candolleomyces aberdarensis]
MPQIAKDQQALVVEKKHAEFTVASVPVPKPGKDEVLVKVYSSALNPVDWKIQKHGWFVEEYPAVLGTDIAGEVVQLGEGVSESGLVGIGDRVFFQGLYERNEYRGFQQYTLADVHTLAKIPSNVTYDQASSIPVALTAAYVALYNATPHGLGFVPPVRPDGKGKYANTPIVILGGSSSVGQYAIQLAKLSGFSPIITTSSLKHEEWLKSQGATHVVDRNSPLTAQEAEKLASQPVLTVFDAISGADTQEQAIDLVAPGGRIAVVLDVVDAVKAKAEAQNKTTVRVLGLKTFTPDHVEKLREFWANATKLLEDGDLKPNKVEVLPNGLIGIAEGLKRLEANKVSGAKLVAHPQESSS